MPAHFLLFLSLVQALPIYLQVWALDIPSGWRKPNITLSLGERTSLANEALENAKHLLDVNLTFSGDTALALVLHSLLADLDHAANQTRYRSLVDQYFAMYPDIPTLLDKLRQSYSAFTELAYGYAAHRAFTAYNDTKFSSAVENAWTYTRNRTVLAEDIVDGKVRGDLGVKGGSMQLTCVGESLLGGTTDSETSNTFDGDSSGWFLTISAFLYQMTSDQKYLSAATQSADFIYRNLYRSPGLLLPGISHQDCVSPQGQYSMLASAYWIQGLAILYDVTGKRNGTLVDLLQQSIVAATSRVGDWIREDGVQGNDQNPMVNGDLIRALTTAYTRLDSGDLKSYIGHYLGVQYNALHDLAASPVSNSNIYAGKWSGPSSSSISPDPYNQTAAAAVLLAGIFVPMLGSNASSASSSSYMTTTTGAMPSPTSGNGRDKGRKPVGAIVGGTLGGLALLGFVLLGLIYWRRRQKKSERLGEEQEPGPLSPRPFMLQLHQGQENMAEPATPSMHQTTKRAVKNGHITPAREPTYTPREQDGITTQEIGIYSAGPAPTESVAPPSYRP
ncbi:hypothetical protein VNI00_017385 [Paramarasmius palmivorus]|uniref:Glycoside hydrolase family 76 protein n=1 Tax=Paramarasmius palmivorus TaxID=297713 RepID=A0AAW0B6M3_9AGAR